MKFYQHKISGLVIGSFDELLDPINNDGERSGGCFTRVIIPSKQIGNGVKYHIMHYSEISGNFKRISTKKAHELFPDFGQYRHMEDNTIERHNLKDVRKRKECFGVKFSNEHNRYINAQGKFVVSNNNVWIEVDE